MPEHHARRFFLLMEQVQCLADLAMVALLGFFQLMQVGLEILVAEPRRAVDAREHRVVGIAAPIRAGHLHQLERAQLARVRHVRAAAQVGEFALRIERKLFVRGNALDDLGLVFLADAAEEIHRLVARFHAARHGQLFLDDLFHLRLDLHQIVWRERALVGEVVDRSRYRSPDRS